MKQRRSTSALEVAVVATALPATTTLVAATNLRGDIKDRAVCRHAQRPHGDAMPRVRFIPASPQPQRLTLQCHPRLRSDLNPDRYLSAISCDGSQAGPLPSREPHRSRHRLLDQVLHAARRKIAVCGRLHLNRQAEPSSGKSGEASDP